MSDDFNINILIILNEIDVNLLNNKILDSPNLLNIVKFEPLTAKEANNLSQFLSNKQFRNLKTLFSSFGFFSRFCLVNLLFFSLKFLRMLSFFNSSWF
jgi:hypothetical protein